jgi:hypothetical protein
VRSTAPPRPSQPAPAHHQDAPSRSIPTTCLFEQREIGLERRSKLALAAGELAEIVDVLERLLRYRKHREPAPGPLAKTVNELDKLVAIGVIELDGMRRGG